MGDKYKHDADGVSTVVSSLQKLLDDYKDRIIDLTNLVDVINGSDSWIDKDVKTSFVNTCNSYLTLYKDLATAMEKYINYLIRKSASAAAIESAYTRR